ncbi:spore coat U domain-containing protein [Psychrobacter sp. ANT_H59]|uniref:Csu type fimbrial protein n=1 Tax=Psychrobacter sp. ANT_H59 TaxID=2597354 RepID=UPI00165D6491|nr:spore coat protein U domain-containing protein [Psychrobacter sp. ANT_H59]
MTAAVFAVGSFAVISSANAATDTGAFGVELAVTEICKVNSLTDTHKIDFGTFAAGATVTEASAAAISVNCSTGTGYNIGLLGSGSLSDGEVSPTTVAYKLLKDTGGAEWSNTGTADVPGTGRGMAAEQGNSHTVYASILPGAIDNLKAGTYTDTVNITVTY